MKVDNERWRVGLLVGVALLILAGLQQLEPRFFLRDDNAVLFFPDYLYAYETLIHHGELPLVNHHQMFGGTFLASGITGVFQLSLYPAAGLLELLRVDAAHLIDLLVSLHLVLAALGMWKLLREQGVPALLAGPLALCWAFLPFTVVISRSWAFVSYLAAYLPWNQLLLQRFLAAPSARGGGGLVAVKVLYVFCGYAQYVALTAVVESVFVAAYLLAARRRLEVGRRLLALSGVYLFTGLLTAPLLLPMWQAKQVSLARAVRIPPQIALESALQLDQLGLAQLFRSEALLVDAVPTLVYFLGPWWLLGVFAALWRWRRLGAGLGAALLAGLTALAICTSLYYLLYLTPLFASLRWPFKAFPIAAFFLLLPAAQVWRDWAGGERRRLRLAAALAGLNLLLQLLLLLPAPWRSPFTPYGLDRSVAELRAAPLLQPIGDQGRVALLAAGDDPPSRASALGLGFVFATLAGKYQVHGYDPLRAKLNVEIGLKIPNDGEIRIASSGFDEVAARPPARYLILAGTSRLRRLADLHPGARRLAESEGFVVYEMAAALPIVHRLEDGRALPFRWRTNGIELDLPADFPGGSLLVDVAGLEGYRVLVDGRDQGAPEVAFRRPLLAAPPGPAHLELRYRDRRFEAGLLLCALGLAGLLLALRRGDVWLAPRSAAAAALGDEDQLAALVEGRGERR